MCTICGKPALYYSWNFYSCEEHKPEVYEEIMICDSCGKHMKTKMTCCCGRTVCINCVPHQHYILRTVDGDYCQDCDMYIVGHQCYFFYVPRDHLFCKKNLVEGEYGYYDTYNDIELDNNLLPVKNEIKECLKC